MTVPTLNCPDSSTLLSIHGLYISNMSACLSDSTMLRTTRLSTTPLRPCLRRTREQTALDCRWYRFKKTLHEDMARADVVVSHAGAGSVMEALGEPCRTSRPKHLSIGYCVLVPGHRRLRGGTSKVRQTYLRVDQSPVVEVTCCYHTAFGNPPD